MRPIATDEPVDLLVRGAELVETMDGPPLTGGWVAIRGGLVAAVGPAGSEPPAAQVMDAHGCLVTPGLVNTHHHMFQNLTRAVDSAANVDFVTWARTLAPGWARMDEEAIYVSTWVAFAELALGGCTTSSDHLFAHPVPGLIDAQIRAAQDFGFRFHAVRGAIDVGPDEGGVLPISFVQGVDTILEDSERLVSAHHDRSPGSMVQVALGPSSTFDVSRRLMIEAADLAERLDVRLHTHLLQLPGEDELARMRLGSGCVDLLEETGWASDRTWLAHSIFPSESDMRRLGGWRVGAAHCPSSNALISSGVAPVQAMRAAGMPVGLGVDGSASTDHGSMWLEARTALLLGRMIGGPAAMTARDVLEIATTGSAACLGRSGQIGVIAPGAAADLVVWPQEGVAFAGSHSDPTEAWLRCGPVSARHTIINGRVIVRDGELTVPGLAEMLSRHRAISLEWLAAIRD